MIPNLRSTETGFLNQVGEWAGKIIAIYQDRQRTRDRTKNKRTRSRPAAVLLDRTDPDIIPILGNYGYYGHRDGNLLVL